MKEFFIQLLFYIGIILFFVFILYVDSLAANKINPSIVPAYSILEGV